MNPDRRTAAPSSAAVQSQESGKPIALVVLLENVGHIAGITLPAWVMRLIDFSTEEYAKLLLRLYGANRCYDRVVILEDARATGEYLAEALLDASRTHTVDLLLLVHGRAGVLVGYRGKEFVGAETFDYLRLLYAANPACLNLRMVYGLNCHGLTLAATWQSLGARAANGAAGVNWFPEPSLSVFLRRWLAGRPYSEAVTASNLTADRWWSKVLKADDQDGEHPWIASSRQIVFGVEDVTISS